MERYGGRGCRATVVGSTPVGLAPSFRSAHNLPGILTVVKGEQLLSPNKRWGLLYGTYCPPDVRVDSRGIGDSVEITQAARGGGTVLGSALAEQIAAVATTAPPLPD